MNQSEFSFMQIFSNPFRIAKKKNKRIRIVIQNYDDEDNNYQNLQTPKHDIKIM